MVVANYRPSGAAAAGPAKAAALTAKQMVARARHLK
jgi:hypothetical protein